MTLIWLRFIRVVVGEHAQRRAIDIVELAGAQRPNEGDEPDHAEPDRQRYQDDQDVQTGVSVASEARVAGVAG